MNVKNIKLDIKKIDLQKITKANRDSNWQKAVFGVLVISLFIFAASISYLFFRPLNSDLAGIIDTEVTSTKINFDFKTLEKLKSRQLPGTVNQAPTGKNPFTPF